MIQNNWHVITGGPSVGKTKLLGELAKLGYRVVPEVARTVIDEGLSSGLTVDKVRADEKKFQEKVALRKQEIETALDPSEFIFFDRGMQDTIAYMNYYNFSIKPSINNLMKASHYKKVFLLEPLSTYKPDYARTEDKRFIKAIHDLLAKAYTSTGMKPVLLPDIGLDARLEVVLKEIEA